MMRWDLGSANNDISKGESALYETLRSLLPTLGGNLVSCATRRALPSQYSQLPGTVDFLGKVFQTVWEWTTASDQGSAVINYQYLPCDNVVIDCF
jgi:hypothetical protein